jgi:hypothetical protein
MNDRYEIRLNNVKLMHDTMTDMNNEDAYMVWIWEMPDCPNEDDFEWFAEDEDRYIELYNYFMKLLKRYAKDGLYKPSESVQNFVSKLGIEIEILN